MRKFILLTNADPETPGNVIVNTEMIPSIYDEKDCTSIYAILDGEELLMAEVTEKVSEIYPMLK